MEQPSNLFDELPTAVTDEIFQTILKTPDIRIERIVSQGQTSPEGFWYDQDTHEWVLLIQGAARLEFEGEEPIELKSGSFIHIPAHRRHRVAWTDPHQQTLWLAIHYS